MELTWLGQGGFLLASGGWRMAVDPYLSDALAAKGLVRLTPPPCGPSELARLQAAVHRGLEASAPSLVVCTHDHGDHLDPQSVVPIANAWPECRFAGPPAVVDHLVQLGIALARCTALRAGDKLSHVCFTIAAAPARHDGQAIGVVIEAEGLRVYISGDTLFFDALAAGVREVAGGSIDAAMICVNGRWGNMTWQEAVEVIRELQPRLAIPMHYGMFQQNTVDPTPFLAAVRGMNIKAAKLEVGVAVELRGLLRQTGT
jgi:L-ascorbate metabolism protein UlaG (beta-lactamase superfamily)